MLFVVIAILLVIWIVLQPITIMVIQNFLERRRK